MSDFHEVEYEEGDGGNTEEAKIAARKAKRFAKVAAIEQRIKDRQKPARPTAPIVPKTEPPAGVAIVTAVEADAQKKREHQDWAVERNWSSTQSPRDDLVAFREACAHEFSRIKAITLAGKIACGDILEHVGDDTEGRPVYGETKNADRLRAIEWLANRAFGMPRQSVEIDVNPQSPQLSETGEAVMQRVMATMAAHLLTAPEGEKQRFLTLMGGAKVE